MRRYFCAMALIAINAWCAEIPTPSQMYIVSAAFSDFGALFYYRVVDIRTDGPDVVIRYARIGWTNPTFCARKIVQATQVRLRNRTIKDLVKANNPCAVNPRDLAAMVKKYSITAGHFETFSAGVVATCGPTTSVLELPDESKVDLKKLKSANAKMSRLWNLISKCRRPRVWKGRHISGAHGSGGSGSSARRAGNCARACFRTLRPSACGRCARQRHYMAPSQHPRSSQ